MYKAKKMVRATSRQIEILQILARRQQWTIGEIATALGVSSAAATKNVDRLERLGLVTRAKDLMDRRVINVQLTVAGLDAVQQERSVWGKV